MILPHITDNEQWGDGLNNMDRRHFLRVSGTAAASVAALLAGEPVFGLLKYIPTIVTNPLDYYPNKGWEDIYRKLVIRYERLQCTHLGFKYLAYSMINLRWLIGKK